MDFRLFTGDYAYSSWSLRGWLLLDAFGVPFDLVYAHMRTDAFEEMRARMAPARLVPALEITAMGMVRTVVWESLAIAETVHEFHPQVGLWPDGDAVRPVARAIAAEMHSGFQALRGACPMNMRRAYRGFEPDAAVCADLDRLALIWAHARSRRTREGEFLFGTFSAVDAFFAPVASRVATYGLEMVGEDRAYVAALLAHPSVRRWRAMGMADTHIQPQYEMELEARDNPHEPAITGEITGDDRVAANSFCPFTGEDIAPGCRVEVEGRVLGFGDAFTAAKVAADPYCWPEIASLLPARPG